MSIGECAANARGSREGVQQTQTVRAGWFMILAAAQLIRQLARCPSSG
jgi:hypothetical protein